MAKLVISTQELKQGLTKTGKIAGSSANLDNLRAYYFFLQNGNLVLASSDLKLTLFAPLKATVDPDLPVFALDCRFLDDFVKWADDEITMEVGENSVTLWTGNCEVKAPIKASELFESQVTPGDWQETWDASETAYMLQSLLTVVSKTHALTDGDDSIFLDGSRAFCFDGSNIALVPFKTKNKYVITNPIAKQLLTLLTTGKVHLKVSDDETLVVVQTEEDLFSFRNPIYENRHNFDGLLNSLREKLVMAFPKKQFVRSLQRCLLTGAKEFQASITLQDSPRIAFTAYENSEEVKDYLPIPRYKKVDCEALNFLGNLEDFTLLASSVPQDLLIITVYETPDGMLVVGLQDELKKFQGYLGVEAV